MLQQFMAAFGKMTEGAGGLDVNLTKTEKRLKNIGLATKGIRQIADAFGAAGKNLVRFVDSLELAAQSIAALIEAQKKIETARKAEETRKAAGGKPRSGAAAGVENLLNTIAMVNAAIGAVASIISTISAAAKFLGIGKSELEIEHNRIVKENNKRLAELTSELSGFQLDVAGQGRISAALADPQLIAHGRNAANFDAIGQQYGVTLADTARAAKKYGIEIFDKNGNTIKGALIQLRTAMDAARDAFFVWADTLESDVSKRELERKAFGIETTPLMAVQDWLGDLKKNAPAAFEKFFAGVDLTDMEAVRKAYQNMVKSITDGTFELDKNLTKGLKFDTFEEWLAFVKEGADAFIKLNEATNDLTESMLNVPSWFRTATNRFGAALPGPGELPPITAPTTPTMGVTPTLTPPLGPGGKPTAAAGPGPGTVVTGGVNFTINQQPGEDADALAERIVNKLRRDAFLRTGSSALPGEGEQN
jgi:hypothetical protein